MLVLLHSLIVLALFSKTTSLLLKLSFKSDAALNEATPKAVIGAVTAAVPLVAKLLKLLLNPSSLLLNVLVVFPVLSKVSVAFFPFLFTVSKAVAAWL